MAIIITHKKRTYLTQLLPFAELGWSAQAVIVIAKMASESCPALPFECLFFNFYLDYGQSSMVYTGSFEWLRLLCFA
ncbi:hypothetical protein [Rhizobium tubonense]|uniref:hypothetical protein n=1 Tax=Rhizobium tubonense TaxID=484088 RepID=UPI0011B7E1A0|nr:hypothetical protein [Rhizobium tubonense]